MFLLIEDTAEILLIRHQISYLKLAHEDVVLSHALSDDIESFRVTKCWVKFFLIGNQPFDSLEKICDESLCHFICFRHDVLDPVENIEADLKIIYLRGVWWCYLGNWRSQQIQNVSSAVARICI